MAKKEKVFFCEECAREITDRDSLIVTIYFIFLVTYHDTCYSQVLKGWQSFFVNNQPVNSFFGNFKSIAALLLGLFLFFISRPFWIVAFILFIFPLIRLYSWFTVERYLE
ncbi:hypothetical protein J2S74_002205 [Evansella vedderi]|uniref:Permease n=1 Tax=Evansella vedderi TaxID=38282 RepID=A0ABT9ZU98_9BACI|nr:hypothetical protein [Evansella vedderi]MDQ0254826.1 hypothetical protein [Evansella vedderi]